MQYVKLIFCALFVGCALTSTSLAEQFDPKLIPIIKQTASAICDTVIEAKGTKSKLQLQGEIETKLSGMVGKLIDAGVSGGVALVKEEFEGLTQEATASGLVGDRACRERVFDKMFDKIGSLPDQSSMYEKDGRRTDLRSVQSFMKYAPISVSRFSPKYVCSGPDTSEETREISFKGEQLSITNWTENSSERCETGHKAKRRETLICTANISDLDEVIEVWSGPKLTINCLTGNCVSCLEKSKWKNKHQGWKNESRKFEIDYLNIYVGGEDYVLQSEIVFNKLLMSLSRLISGGSDAVFCESPPHYCRI